MEALRNLPTLPEWAAYQRALEARYEHFARRLLDCSSFEEYREVLGCLRAIQEMYHLNDLVVGKADALDDYRRDTAERQRAADALHRASFLASRLWTPGVPVRQ